ncbi:MAG: cupredoxin domain-containing protein [Acidimicrobiales bacterium]
MLGPRRRLSGVVGAAALVAVAGCGGGGGDDAPVELVEGVVVDVRVVDNSYEPETLEVAAGTEVLFDNRGRNEHDVIPVDPERDEITITLEELPPGESVTRRLTQPGTYEYYCSIHGTETAGMIGSITVTEGGP